MASNYKYPLTRLIGHLSERKTMSTFLYFAYGSNMSERRLKVEKRAPSAKVIGTGVLNNHCLTFHKRSEDGSGKCTIECSESDKVYGVLFKINNDEECKLDKAEGACGNGGYKKVTRKIEIRDSKCKEYKCGGTVCAKTYQATEPQKDLKPYFWYKQHVLIGAIEQNLPPLYIHCLIQVPAKKDPCPKHVTRELTIYS